jgi:hypothetical protein
MNNLNMVIVGNKFENFSNKTNIFTYKQFKEYMFKYGKLGGARKVFVYIGQGLSDKQITNIKSIISVSNLEHVFDLMNFSDIKRASSHITHKRYDHNIMISEPSKINDSNYSSFLLLDDSCAEMSDHVTGQHIQGMVLLEAARQMINAVSDKYLLDINDKKGFVLNKLSSDFKEYVYPLEVELNFVINKIRRDRRNNIQADAKIIFYQQGRNTLEVDISFSVYDSKILDELEARMAYTSIYNAISIDKAVA